MLIEKVIQLFIMTLTWTFYTKPGDVITLTVHYVPVLDKKPLPSGGYLNPDTNTAYVNWETYQLFNSPEVKARQDAYRRLTVLTAEGMQLILMSWNDAITGAMLSLHPLDLLPALVEMKEPEKQMLLEYYQGHESYLHCSIIYKMMDAYLDDPVHNEP